MTTNTFVFKNIQISYTHNLIDVNKPSLICLHGFLEHKHIFNFLFEDTYFNANNLISVDLLGHNESETIGYILTMEDQAQMIRQLLSHLNLKKIALIGHSLGGYVALAILELFPNLVTKIFLLNSTAKADNETKKANRLRGINLVKKQSNMFIQLALANLFDTKTLENNKDEIEILKSKALKNKTQGVLANMYGMLERKDRLFLLKNNPNVIYIAGEKDLIIPINEIREEVKTNQNKLFEIDGYHTLWLEQPEKIKKILKDNL